jgi:hypothetical protein
MYEWETRMTRTPKSSAPKFPKGDFGDQAEVPFRGFRGSVLFYDKSFYLK